jgi:two-component system sensor histidine kinase AgrC
MVELNREYYPIFDNILHDVRRKQHEFKNHLNAIYGICYLTDTDVLKNELKKYIKFLNYTLKDIDDIININNKVLAAVIYSKLCEAKNKQIKFSYTINIDINNFIINEYELVEVLSNLLNNAFEAVNDLSKNEKIVYLKLDKEQKYYFIEIGNKGLKIDPNNINKIFKKGFSTKNKNIRGYGLYNVKTIVESYGGHIQVSLENGYTIFKILF